MSTEFVKSKIAWRTGYRLHGVLKARFAAVFLLVLAFGLAGAHLAAQEAEYGVAIPLEIAGGILNTDRTHAAWPSKPVWTAGFQVLARPELKRGPHWYVYSAI